MSCIDRVYRDLSPNVQAISASQSRSRVSYSHSIVPGGLLVTS